MTEEVRLDSNRIVVVGASAGGVESLSSFVGSLSPELDASVFIVLHIPPNCVSSLPSILSKKGPLSARHAVNGERIKSGQIYVAPPDQHLLVEKDNVIVARGPKENRNRPSIDALFRSAAYTYGSSAIGIVLSGALDDGTSGLWTIKRLGGIAIIQNPDEAAFDSMPFSTLDFVEIDHCISTIEMGPLLDKLTKDPSAETSMPSEDEDKKWKTEISIAIAGDAFRKGIIDIGSLTPYTCPECNGALIELKGEPFRRFRCHTGHAYSMSALLSGVMDKIDSSYWDVMRSLEEAAILMDDIGTGLTDEGKKKAAAMFREEGERARRQSRLLRSSVLSGECFSGDSLIVRAEKAQ